MKKLLIVPIMALGMLFSTNANAQVDDSKKAVSEQTAQQDYKQIDKAQLPTAVTAAVEKDFNGSSIAEAYIAKDKTYKLVLTNDTGEKGLVFVDANGKWIKPSK
ncbi:MAG TPA: hypothetical protein VFM82_07320 [Flavobacteriaceae bacterium]|nr:hypothetical protein [Flavobacteriaceae bacterium]